MTIFLLHCPVFAFLHMHSPSSFSCNSLLAWYQFYNYLGRKNLASWSRYLLGIWKIKVERLPAREYLFIHSGTAPKLISGQLRAWHVESVPGMQKAGLSLLFRQGRNVEICHLTMDGYPDLRAGVVWCLICQKTGCHRLSVRRLIIILTMDVV